MAGGFLGSWLVDHTRRWHAVLSAYLALQGLAFVGFTYVRSFGGLLGVSLAWGVTSTLSSIATQAAMTWLWGERAAAWLQFNNSTFGLGALLAPALVSLDLGRSGSFHNAYY